MDLRRFFKKSEDGTLPSSLFSSPLLSTHVRPYLAAPNADLRDCEARQFTVCGGQAADYPGFDPSLQFVWMKF